jgi:predicted Zn-dependent protease
MAAGNSSRSLKISPTTDGDGRRGRQEEAARYRARYEQLEADSQRFRKVTELLRGSPQNAALRAEAGVLLLRHDQEAQGLGWLSSAMQIDPFQPAANQSLADYYAQRDQRNRADQHRQRAAQGLCRWAARQFARP